MSLTVLQVAYPFAQVTDDTAGGAEQILAAIDRALIASGHRSIVVAASGSRVHGELVSVPMVSGPLTPEVIEGTYPSVREAIARVLSGKRVDLVHLHGVDYLAYLPSCDPPVLVTLHMPPSFYPEAVRQPAKGVFLHGVSRAQHEAFAAPERLLAPIPNGIPLDRFGPPCPKDDYVVCLGRVCPEKGYHLALDAAKAAGMPLVLAGEVFPYPDHVRYFEEMIRPRLSAHARFVGSVGVGARRELLRRARCLLVPSVVPETSSLVSMEALASGTPVVAFRRGALPEILEDGKTGFLVDDVDGMVEALRHVGTLEPNLCRRIAEERFSDAAMSERYLARYSDLARDAGPR